MYVRKEKEYDKEDEKKADEGGGREKGEEGEGEGEVKVGGGGGGGEGAGPRLASEACIRKAAACLIFKARIAVSTRKLREARKYAGVCLALMTRCSSGGMCLEEPRLVGAGVADALEGRGGLQAMAGVQVDPGQVRIGPGQA